MNRMYSDLAWAWPLISPPEDYIDEAEEYERWVHRFGLIQAYHVLHMGCGGGHIDWTLKRAFQLTGVDLSPAMLALARKLNPGVSYQLGDMRFLRMGRQFDAVIIADSIVYMQNEADLQAAFVTAWEHLAPGGVFCTFAEHLREHFDQDALYCTTHQRADTRIHLIHHYYDPNPQDTRFEMTFVYLVREANNTTVDVDCHTGGLFSLETWMQLLERVGFQVFREQTQAGDQGFICRKPLLRTP